MGNCNELPGARPLPILPISMVGVPKPTSNLALLQQGTTSTQWLYISPVVPHQPSLGLLSIWVQDANHWACD